MMKKRTPVILKPFKPTRYKYEKLRVCRNCGNYTILWDESCPQCGKSLLLGIENMALMKVKLQMQTERLIAVLITLAAVLFSSTFQHIAWSLGLGAGGIILLSLVQRSMLEAQVPYQIQKILETSTRRLMEGLKLNIEAAYDMRSSDEPLAYEMMREIATVVYSDRLRLQQLKLLCSFQLRKDMDLQLEELLISDFEEEMVDYIGEIARIKPELIRERIILYVTQHEPEILILSRGQEILTAVAGAALRKARYVTLYPEFMERYARHLPKERFLRLYHLIMEQEELRSTSLAKEVADIHRNRYTQNADISISADGEASS
ncbi:hypothetical protein J2Z69_001832 [Paenibacillus shirakamiensis]|uniref:Uncharacterized protein n=1 Tax=Paenibacillus shirakamiensis TaxID=1265935 RepID=A0ABS4JIK5_9BACL|nr:hypothetical protein [Paenibacillus shirakamiensis]MBP2000801.1 hypothetical protein [Paenibacillus shirakamiensis]